MPSEDAAIANDFAILAPIPKNHLESGLNTCDNHGKVAYGSSCFEFFRDIDKRRGQLDVRVLIYASWQEEMGIPEASWCGIYAGFKESRRGRPPAEYVKFRPASTSTDGLDWGIYWLIRNLRPLSQSIEISKLCSLEGKQYFAPPRRPLLIENPYDFDLI